MPDFEYEKQQEKKYLDLFCDYLYKSFGIFTNEEHKGLLLQKLHKLMRDFSVATLADYYHIILSPPITQSQKDMINKFIDTITVHKTNFFRENAHFEYLKKNIEMIVKNSPTAHITHEIRIWSAACSTGEEPYTLAMVMKECLPAGYVPKILATDVSPKVLQTALSGQYSFGPEDYISQNQIGKFFTKTPEGKWSVNSDIRNCVTFRLFNLMSQFPFRHPFDIIFCKNVMIYFDKNVQQELINKFYDSMTDNGLLFIGHSESLIQLKHSYNYAQPTVYQKPGSKEGSLCR